MKIVYPATIEQIDGQYYLEFPDLKGCQTWGDSLEETMQNAQEALEGYLISLYENEEPVAPPSDISDISTDKNIKATYIFCNIEIKSQTLVKKTLTIPEWVNELGIKHNINFSKVLTEAIINSTKSVI